MTDSRRGADAPLPSEPRASAPWAKPTGPRPGRSCPRCGHVRCEWNEGVSTQHKAMSTHCEDLCMDKCIGACGV